MILSRNAALAAAFTVLALAPGANAQKGGADVTPPARITTLSMVEIGLRDAAFLVNVTGDDGNTNPATSTELRYRKTSECDYNAVNGTAKLPGTQTDCFNASNWAALSGKSVSTPPAPGMVGVFRTDVNGSYTLLPGTSYLFAFRMVDDKGNRSPVSPLLEGTTRSVSTLTPWANSSSFVSNQLGAGARSSLAYDAQGQPVIAYGGNSDHVRVTRSSNGGTSWTAPVLTETGTSYGMSPRLVPLPASASGAEFGLVYGGGTALKYRTVTGSSLGTSAETIVTASGASYRADGLVVAGSGPFVAYSPASTGTMNISFARRIMVNGNATWRLKAYTHPGLPSGTNVRNWDVAIALDPSDPTGNTIALAYGTRRAVTGGTSYALYYVTLTLAAPTSSTDSGITWGTPVRLDVKDYALATASTPAAPQTGLSPSLAFDAAGVLYLSHTGGYRDLDKTLLERRVNGVWQTQEEVGYGRADAMQTGVIVGHEGRISVALRRANVGYVAHKVGAAWELRLLHDASTGAYDGFSVGPGGPAAAYYYRNPVSGVDELRYAVSAPLAAPAQSGTLASTEATPLGMEAGPLALLPAYPNPFTDRTTLRFQLPEAGRVELTVYDLLGREVARPLSGDMEAGSHAVMLDGSDLVAGTYVVRLRAGALIKTQSITFTR